VAPDVVVCLGATAAQALLGPRFRVTKQRGQWVSAPGGKRVLARVHPSILLALTKTRQRELDAMVANLTVVRAAANALGLTMPPPLLARADQVIKGGCSGISCPI
jgi:DNA polymerase